MAASTSGLAQQKMDRRLLDAAMLGDSKSMKEMASSNASVLLRTTPQGNTCLHISSVHGHEGFCKDVLALNHSLLSEVNFDRETPLITSVASGHASLALVLLRRCEELGLRHAILQQDKGGCNVLHHAIRSGYKDLALELIAAEPALSQGVNNCNESPMFDAAMRDFTDVFEKLLEIPDSAHDGHCRYNALHAAARNGNSVIATKIMQTRPGMARKEGTDWFNPMVPAILLDKIDVLRVLLEHDSSLGYDVSDDNGPLLMSAAFRGHVDAARELLKHCPDAPYCNSDGSTCLHQAISSE